MGYRRSDIPEHLRVYFEGSGDRVIRVNESPYLTVKPLHLIEQLVRMVTPPGGVCLEPFSGSGTTPLACAVAGVDFVAIDQEKEYVEMSNDRVASYRVRKPS
ncbi:DNA methyltransferase (plasmid) [Aneurinibacillus sp. Ricciae_BoGa-3]|uniref:DNA methyltransferase n=1 Tax=Aneurinibacillus sp. Ricciae_BoGa-3 TaxID=3022697 RepID=UPI0023414682|nr:DNA methyltransferase [Aneurinibacillus sp. Ricciae_BoGa-3]WCK57741.1 DNA methyltransferase [Aneurinibacillus sp. Ricciae_BoGa-3]